MTQVDSGDELIGGSRGPAAASQTWWIYQGTGRPLDPRERDRRWPEPPHWRAFHGGPDLPPSPPDDDETDRRLGESDVTHPVNRREAAMVNAALYLRRPLLVTGRPGSGKSSLAFRIARELGLSRVLHWPIVSRTTLRSGLYEYDAIGRAQAAGRRWTIAATLAAGAGASADRGLGGGTGPGADGVDVDDGEDIGDFVTLGPLGSALLPRRLPRVLLIDEMDKSDIDLPNDLLNIFEEGEFSIPELVRARRRSRDVVVHTADPGVAAAIRDGIVRCHEFPIVVITSSGEREFPPAFLRRCLMLEIPDPDRDRLAAMVAAHFPRGTRGEALIREFLERDARIGLAADQLLNAVHLATSGAFQQNDEHAWRELLDAIWHRLSSSGP
jgi:MoxR-like ATPase